MFGQHELENLTKYMDHNSESNGFININKILQQVNAAAPVNRAHTNVWNKWDIIPKLYIFKFKW
jgi:hypothetical protein